MPKEKVSFRVDAAVMRYIRARASGEGRSASLVVNEILGEASQGITPADGFDVILPSLNAAVHQAIHQSVDGLNSRLKHLLSKTLVSSLANRLMLFQLLAAEFGEETARTIHDEATAEATRRLEPMLKRINKTGEEIRIRNEEQGKSDG
jgi:hypothetical protein